MSPAFQATAHPRLSGPWLWLARLAWAAGMLLYLGVFIYVALERSLAKQPADRFPTAGEFIAALNG